MGEHDRLIEEYRRRDADERLASRYRVDDPVVRRAIEERDAAIKKLSHAHGVNLLDGRILDLGCGGGGELARLIGAGAHPSRLVGADLLEYRLKRAHDKLPGCQLVVADGAQLPFPEGTFDTVMLFTVLSSVLDESVRSRVAGEVRRVLRRGGAVLWYDFRWNPTNRQTIGIGPQEMRHLFPGFDHETRRVTLAPPIARRFGARWERIERLLVRIPALRSHSVGIAVKSEMA